MAGKSLQFHRTVIIVTTQLCPGPQPNPRRVTLKEGIDLAQLHSGEGTVFELDPSGPLPGGGEQKEAEEQEFDREEVLRHLNFDCIDIGGEEEADSDEVRHNIAVWLCYTLSPITTVLPDSSTGSISVPETGSLHGGSLRGQRSAEETAASGRR